MIRKNKFWASLEKIGVNLTKSEIDQVFVVFDRDGKGYFTFNDLTRVSEQV